MVPRLFWGDILEMKNEDEAEYVPYWFEDVPAGTQFRVDDVCQGIAYLFPANEDCSHQYRQVYVQDYDWFMRVVVRGRTLRAQKRKANGTKKVRDSQRQKVYDAERAYFKWTDQYYLISRKDARDLLEKCLTSHWYHKRYANRSVVLEFSNRGTRTIGSYHPRDNKIKLMDQGCSTWVLIHELAHAVVTMEYDRGTVAAHGREYCKIYLDLVGHFLGSEHKEGLRESFKKHGVKYSKPRTDKGVSREFGGSSEKSLV